MEGINKAKAKGVYRGRRPTISSEQVKRLKDEGLGGSEIARRLGIGRASAYRLLDAKDDPKSAGLASGASVAS